MRSTSSTFAVVATCTLVAVAASGCTRASLRSTPNAYANAYGAPVVDGMARLRAATQPFRSLDAAVAAGYARDVPNCLVHEHHGAMGYHHSNPAYSDAKVEIEHPEILLYERLPNGEYRLNGVEFIVPYRSWARDSIAPRVMDQSLKHEDNLKIWYLHVWAWTPNSEGLFADFHPDVQCAPGTSKVFKPYSAELQR